MIFNSNSSVVELTPNNYNNGKFTHPLLKNKKGMVACTADWCNFCVRLGPTYSKVAKILGHSFPLFYIDCVKYEDFVRNTLKVTSFPTIFYIDRNGKTYSTYQGERTEQSMLQDICNESKVCRRL